MQNQQVMTAESVVSQYLIFQTPLEKIREAIAANLADSRMSSADLERIKIPAGGGTAWTIQTLNGEEMVKELNGIVVDWRDKRAYWSRPMEDSDGSAPPDCYSLDGRTGIGKPGGDCHNCPYSLYGSDPKGIGQACKASREFGLLREDKILPVILSLPPTSIKPARQYQMRLAAEVIPLYAALTTVSLERTKNSQGIAFSRATFTLAGRLTNEEAERIKEYAGMIRPLLESAPPALIATNSHQPEGEII